MKYIVIIADGMADEPVLELGNKTPLQVAEKPYLNLIARKGRNGMLKTIPSGLLPSTETAILSIMGYDVSAVYEGRASLEAAGMGVSVEPDEMVMRCNLVYIDNDKIVDYSAGQISTAEATELILYLQEKLGTDIINFYSGISFRHVLKVKFGNKNISCTPPHEIHNLPFHEYLIKEINADAKETANTLNRLIIASQRLLNEHIVNKIRVSRGLCPANGIWLWSPGYKPNLPTFDKVFPIGKSSVITAVDLVRGIGFYAGLSIIDVEGATGSYNTNYEGKAQAAIEALRDNDMVFLHIEASDEAGHEGNVGLKIKTIENLDARIIKPIYEKLEQMDENVVMVILPDHPTPCNLRKHTCNAVPFAIYHKNIIADSVQYYDEFSALNGCEGLLYGGNLLKRLLSV